MKIAQRSDWQTRLMPNESKPLAMQESYTLQEFEQISRGLIPQQMEDKWFIYYEAPWLYFHRSWTGFCIYQVRFAATTEGMQVVEVLVNANAEQNPQQDDGRDVGLLRALMNIRAGRDAYQAWQEFRRG